MCTQRECGTKLKVGVWWHVIKIKSCRGGVTTDCVRLFPASFEKKMGQSFHGAFICNARVSMNISRTIEPSQHLALSLRNTCCVVFQGEEVEHLVQEHESTAQGAGDQGPQDLRRYVSQNAMAPSCYTWSCTSPFRPSTTKSSSVRPYRVTSALLLLSSCRTPLRAGPPSLSQTPPAQAIVT